MGGRRRGRGRGGNHPVGRPLVPSPVDSQGFVDTNVTPVDDEGDSQGIVDPVTTNISPPPVDSGGDSHGIVDPITAELNEYKAILVRNGLPERLFTETVIPYLGFTLSRYVEALRALFKDKDDDDIWLLFVAARQMRMIEHVNLIHIANCEWSLILQLFPVTETRDVLAYCVAKGFIHMRNNYLREVRLIATRAHRKVQAIRDYQEEEEEIENDNGEKEINIVMEKVEVDLEYLRQRFVPASTYQPPQVSDCLMDPYLPVPRIDHYSYKVADAHPVYFYGLCKLHVTFKFLIETVEYRDLLVDYARTHRHSGQDELCLQPLPVEPPLGRLLLPLWRKMKGSMAED